MKPLGKYVVLDVSLERKNGLILLPEGSKMRNDYTAVVHAVGPEVTSIKKGQEVCFRQGSMLFSRGNELLVIVKEEDILAVL